MYERSVDDRSGWALLTDLYELTMAYGYWKEGLHDRESVFQLTFRENPFGGRFALAAGLADVCRLVDTFRFVADDLEYLATLTASDGSRLFESAFLDYLGDLRPACDLDAVEEGTVVFAQQPLVRVQGPLLQAQILESALLNLVNFQTLVATKAARVCAAAKGRPVLEFGLRRAQGVDGALSASRAAYVGGCAGTSNVLAGKLHDIPVRGTHAHSWVMCFADEPAAFEAYAAALPRNCIFLVDTYDTRQGVENAVAVAHRLRAEGHEIIGIRLDSGDLVALSNMARRVLDDSGFPDARIVASNDLDEYEIQSLLAKGAKIDVWGVGTRLVTAYDQPALGGVYKLAALRGADGRWEYKLKLSEQRIKISTPGIQQVRRFSRDGVPLGDMIHDVTIGTTQSARMVLPSGQALSLAADAEVEDLLVPVFRDGVRVYDPPSAREARARALDQRARFRAMLMAGPETVAYPIGLEMNLWRRKQQMIQALEDK